MVLLTYFSSLRERFPWFYSGSLNVACMACAFSFFSCEPNQSHSQSNISETKVSQYKETATTSSYQLMLVALAGKTGRYQFEICEKSSLGFQDICTPAFVLNNKQTFTFSLTKLENTSATNTGGGNSGSCLTGTSENQQLQKAQKDRCSTIASGLLDFINSMIWDNPGTFLLLNSNQSHFSTIIRMSAEMMLSLKQEKFPPPQGLLLSSKKPLTLVEWQQNSLGQAVKKDSEDLKKSMNSLAKSLNSSTSFSQHSVKIASLCSAPPLHSHPFCNGAT